jgi:hypothetical protein
MAATGGLAGGPSTGCAAFDGRPGRKLPGEGLGEPLRDRLGYAMEQGSVDCPANGAQGRLIMGHQGEVRLESDSARLLTRTTRPSLPTMTMASGIASSTSSKPSV